MAQPMRARFGRYEMISKLGRGGMAETWRARLLGAAGVTKPVLIKKVLAEYANDESFIAMFISEARISATLSHGNIAQVFDFGQAEGEFFLAMEFVDGQPLHRVLKRALRSGLSGIPVPIAVYIALEMCRGLHYAHTRRDDKGAPLGIVHRDISPDNVLLSYEGQVKIVDFGIAKALALRGFQTEPGVVKGKYLFFSPEQASGKEVDARTDVWATGVVLYEMLCGRLPVSGPSYTVLPRLVAGEFPSPRELRPELPESLDHIVMRALAVDPRQRFESSHALGDALAGFLYSSAPRFSSLSVAHLLGVLFREDLKAEAREIDVPGSFIEELELWRSDEAGQVADGASGPNPVPERPAAARAVDAPLFDLSQHRWLVPVLFLGGGLVAGLLIAAPRGESPPAAVPVGAAVPLAPSPTLAVKEARGSAVYPVDEIFLDARRDIIPVPSSAMRVSLNPGSIYRVSEPSFRENTPPVFFWLKSPVAKASGLEGMLSETPQRVAGGREALFFGLQTMGGGAERGVLVEEALTQERTTLSLEKVGHASLDRTFELEGLDPATTYRLKLRPESNWARIRGRESGVVQSAVCVGRASDNAVSASSQWLIQVGTPVEVRGVSALLCGFLDDDLSDNHGQVRMTITHAVSAVAALEKKVTRKGQTSYEDGHSLFLDARYLEAEPFLRRCIDVDPSFAECYLLLGDSLALLGRVTDSVQYFRQFLRLAPYHPVAPRVRLLLKDHDSGHLERWPRPVSP